MLVTLHGLGTVLADCLEPIAVEHPPLKAPGSGMAPVRPDSAHRAQYPSDAPRVPVRCSGASSPPAERACIAIEFRHELRRPVPLALLALAVVGWIIALYSLWSSTPSSASIRQRFESLEASRQALAAALKKQRQAAGTLAEVEQQIEAAKTEVGQAEQEREHARAELAATQKDLEQTRQQLDQAIQQKGQAEQQAKAVQQEAEQAQKTLTEITAMRDKERTNLQQGP